MENHLIKESIKNLVSEIVDNNLEINNRTREDHNSIVSHIHHNMYFEKDDLGREGTDFLYSSLFI